VVPNHVLKKKNYAYIAWLRPLPHWSLVGVLLHPSMYVLAMLLPCKKFVSLYFIDFSNIEIENKSSSLLKILSTTNIIKFFLFSIHLCILITEIPLGLMFWTWFASFKSINFLNLSLFITLKKKVQNLFEVII